MGWIKRTPLQAVNITGGAEPVMLESAVLVVTKDNSGWTNWEIVTNQPIPFSLAEPKSLQFSSGRYSGQCFVHQLGLETGRFAGTGPLAGFEE
jgi:hypothetical protein